MERNSYNTIKQKIHGHFWTIVVNMNFFLELRYIFISGKKISSEILSRAHKICRKHLSNANNLGRFQYVKMTLQNVPRQRDKKSFYILQKIFSKSRLLNCFQIKVNRVQWEWEGGTCIQFTKRLSLLSFLKILNLWN